MHEHAFGKHTAQKRIRYGRPFGVRLDLHLQGGFAVLSSEKSWNHGGQLGNAIPVNLPRMTNVHRPHGPRHLAIEVFHCMHS